MNTSSHPLSTPTSANLAQAEPIDATFTADLSHISAENPHDHYAPLRERLDAYADLLTTQIDNHAIIGTSAKKLKSS